jgi:superfamily I DNA/RNA helicase
MDTNSFENEVKRISALFEQKESEGTWTQFDDSLQKLGLILQGSPDLHPQLQNVFRHRLKDAVLVAVISLF